MEPEAGRWQILYRTATVLANISVGGIAMLFLFSAVPWDSASWSPPPEQLPNSNRQADAAARIRTLSVSGDGQYLDILQGHSTWVRRDAHTGMELWTRSLPRSVFTLARLCSPSDLLIGLNSDEQLEIFHQQNAQETNHFPQRLRSQQLLSCAVSPLGDQIVLLSSESTLWLLGLNDLQVLSFREYPLDFQPDFAEFSPSGDRIALLDGRGRLALWNVGRERLEDSIEVGATANQFASWSADGRRLITCTVDGPIRVWDAIDLVSIQEWQPPSNSTCVARLSRDGALAAVGNDATIVLSDVESGKEWHAFREHEGRVTDLQFGDEDRALFSSDALGGLRRWSVTDRRIVWSVP